MVDLLRANGGENINIYGGGGGVIVPAEIKELMGYGVARLYSPEDGASMGLQGMINDVIRGCDYDLTPLAPKSGDALGALRSGNRRDLARVITAIENGSYNDKLKEENRKATAEIKKIGRASSRDRV